MFLLYRFSLRENRVEYCQQGAKSVLNKLGVFRMFPTNRELDRDWTRLRRTVKRESREAPLRGSAALYR
jgi:hypothetical protein